MMTVRPSTLLAALAVTAMLLPSPASAARIKDVARWEGVRVIQLQGTGLVVGLQGTGDGGKAAIELLRQVIRANTLDIPERSLKARNVALVMVQATLPEFARVDGRLDVTVSSVGDARSLAGGQLVLTPLRDPMNSYTWVTAQGPLAIGGFGASAGGRTSRKNSTNVGRVPGGGVIVKSSAARMLDRPDLELSLRDRDWKTAVGMAKTLNAALLGDFAHALDSGTVRIHVPPQYQGRVPELLAAVEGLEIVIDAPARVVVNERTGTVVVGSRVTIQTVAVAHGGITIEVDTQFGVSQPRAFSRGSTVLVPRGEIDIEQEGGRLDVVGGVSIGEVVAGLNRLGVTPRDLITILQMIKAVGALDAEIIAQ
jgi:flagellar P-ring protein precursor FlgI